MVLNKEVRLRVAGGLLRVASLILLLWAVATLLFFVLRWVPGDPALIVAGAEASPTVVASLRKEMGLDKPLHEQYWVYISNLTKGDMGRSYRSRNPVRTEIGSRFLPTIELAGTSITIAFLVGLPLGILSAVNRNTLLDRLGTMLSIAGVSVPIFWLALLLMILFAAKLQWLPATGRQGFTSLLLPAITIGLTYAASISRMTRSSMLEVLGQDYIRTARAKGLAEKVVIYRHGLRNALIPVITVGGLEFGRLLGGAVITETVFAWPGLGRLLVDAVKQRDYALVQGAVLVFATMVVLVNRLVDFTYRVVDPRLRSH